jgi:hypothetical protein
MSRIWWKVENGVTRSPLLQEALSGCRAASAPGYPMSIDCPLSFDQIAERRRSRWNFVSVRLDQLLGRQLDRAAAKPVAVLGGGKVDLAFRVVALDLFDKSENVAHID